MCLPVPGLQILTCGVECLADPKARALQLRDWSIHGNLHVFLSSFIKDKCERIGNKLARIMDEDISSLSACSSCIKRRKKGSLATRPS
jgi:hypothetical protein